MTNEREAAQLTQRDNPAALIAPGTRVLLWADQVGEARPGVSAEYRNIRPAPDAWGALDFYADPANWMHHKDPLGGYSHRKANDDGARARQALGVEKPTGKGGWRD